MIELVQQGGVMAYVVRAAANVERTTFVTQDEATLQVGFIVYPAGGAVVPHHHLPLERRIVGTPEVILVERGRCYVDLYSEARTLVATRELGPRDVVVLLAGGHGFRMLEDTVLLEVKQGPYLGASEKVRFTP